jgi:hypothetical protein
MIDTIGYWLSGLIALGIVLVGARFFLAPHAAAVAFGVPVRPDSHWEAYLSVKARIAHFGSEHDPSVRGRNDECPQAPRDHQKQTFVSASGVSALGQNRT